MLHLHRAERADTLAEALADVLADPLPDPFRAEVVAVPARGVERWLAQRLAHRLGATGGDGVCAHVAFPSPGEVVAATVGAAAGVDPDDDPWHPARAVWPLLEVIGAGVGEAWCAPLAAHLAGAPSRFAVAAHLADLFAGYATYRPVLLDAWRSGDDTAVPRDLAWQPELWRRLRARIGGPDPAERLTAAVATLAADPDAADLPARLSLFGPTRLPADHLAVLAAVAHHRDVHLWLPHPSPELWERVGQVAPPTVPTRRADPAAEVPRHPLLGSLGRDVRELQLRLATLPGTVDHHHAATGQGPPTLLARVQRDLRDDRAPTGDHVLAPGDRSVQVHACHGPHRQVEVLREVVLGLLAADPTLEPRDILVACPDVETFAPLVSAAFGLEVDDPHGHPGHRLAVRLADRALRQVNPLLDVVGTVLELADARLTASEVLDLLATGPVRHRFALDVDDVARLRDLVARAGVRWGLSAAHRRPFRLEGYPQNTWAAGLDRLLLGVAMEGGSWLGTALPLDDVESGDADRIGRLTEFVDRLAAVVAALAGPQSLDAWVTALTDALDALTATAPADAWQAGQARAELAEAARVAGPHAGDVPLTLADVRGLLAARLRGRPGRANFRTGTLTVATMVPMRSVPHRVICLLGLDDGLFPRAGVDDGDDVLARDPHVGERDVRSEDRQLLLDAVCAATGHLVVLYSGADPRTGARRPPAVPLGELLDAVAATAGGSALDQVVVRHPLQPFDARNFAPAALGVPGPFSFDRVELDGARAGLGGKAPAPVFLPGPLPAAPAGTVALDDLVAFLEHPVKQFLRQRVGLPISDADDDPADALPVALDGLQRWGVGDRLLRDRLAGVDLERCRAAEWRRGELPPGALGNALLAELLDEVEELVAASAGFRKGEPGSCDVDALLPDGTRVVGTVSGLHGEVALRVEYSKLGAKQRVRAWVRLVALTVAQPDRGWRAVTVGRGTRGGVATAVAGPLDADRARGVLVDLVALHRQGLCAPLPLPTNAALAYARTLVGSGSVPDALAEARKTWCEGRYPERDEDLYVRVFGEKAGPDVLDDPFGDLALRLWRPLLATEALR